MALYCFRCIGLDHPEGHDRDFVQMVHHVPEKRIDQYPCPVCGGIGKRDLSKEIPTQSVTGLTPINVSDCKKTLGGELSFAFGRFKRNPDGSVDKNHAPFRDTGELNKYMNGANDLGPPVLDQKTGEPLRRKDGSMVRTGAKLFKYDKNATPSRTYRKKRVQVPSAWVDEKTASEGSGAVPRTVLGMR